MGFKQAKELDEVSRELATLREKKAILIRKFVRENADLPADEVIRGLAKHGGLPAALRWYMIVHEVGILRAIKEVYKLTGRR